MAKKYNHAYFEKMFNEADISNDKFFGKVMSEKKNCLPLLQRILPDKNITDISYPKRQQVIQNHPGQRGVILDVYVEDSKQRAFDVEMQTTSSHNLGKRILLYISYLINHQLRPGQTEEDLKENYVIFICKFDYFHKDQWHYEFNDIPSDIQPEIVLPTGTHILIYNVYGRGNDISKPMQNFLKLVSGKRDIDDPYVKQIENEITALKNDKLWRETMIMDSETLYREGKLEGQQEAAINTIKAMRENNADDASILSLLKSAYSKYFSDEELEKLLKIK